MNEKRTAVPVLVVDLAWLSLLLLLFCARSDAWSLGFDWEDKLEARDPLGGLVPMVIPWAGALGGATISMVGLAKHWARGDWDSRWFPWHILRPLLGAISGTIAFVILIVVLRTAGGLDPDSTSLPDDLLSRGLFLVLAFVVGFRDRMFLNLVSRVVDVLLATEKEEQSAQPRAEREV